MWWDYHFLSSGSPQAELEAAPNQEGSIGMDTKSSKSRPLVLPGKRSAKRDSEKRVGNSPFFLFLPRHSSPTSFPSPSFSSSLNLYSILSLFFFFFTPFSYALVFRQSCCNRGSGSKNSSCWVPQLLKLREGNILLWLEELCLKKGGVNLCCSPIPCCLAPERGQ